jgi:acetyl esterase/lipase
MQMHPFPNLERISQAQCKGVHVAADHVAQIARPPHVKTQVKTVAALAGIAAASVVGGCSPIKTLNTLQPSVGLTETHGVAYGSDPRQVLDIYQPKAPYTKAAMAIYFYGGGWNSGDRSSYPFVGRSLAEEGIVTIIPDYRIFPQVRWPDFLRDGAMAVRWARDNAARLGGDPERIFLIGQSAGAYNAVEIATDKRWLAEVGMTKRDIRGVVGLAGPYDFLPVRTDELRTIFGPEAQRPDTQPINHIEGNEPPMLLIAGTADKTVDPGNTTRMAARLHAAGSPVEARLFPKLNHVLSVGVFSPPLRFIAPIFSETVAFIHARTPPDLAGAPS